MNIIDQLKREIERSGRQAHVAAGSQVARSQVLRFMRGEADLKLTTVARIAAYLGLELRRVRRGKRR